MQEAMTERRTINMTPKMRTRIQQLVEKHPADITEADLIRQAIRDYLDRQEDIVGSRAHFRKAFQNRIDLFQDEVAFHLQVIVALIAHGFAAMLPVFTEETVTAEELIQAAIVAAQQNAAFVQAQIDAIRHDQSHHRR